MKAVKRKAGSNDDSKGDGIRASDDTPVRKKARKFSMKSFRERLKDSPALVLVEFASACDAGEGGSFAAVSEFLASGGQPQEIVKVLHSSGDSEKEALVFPVFSVLKHLLTCYMKVEPQYRQALEEASWQLLTVQPTIVHQALVSTSNTETCKAVLTTLAAMVTISPKLAKEILTHMNLTPKLAGALAKPMPAKSPPTVRTCFIHFLVAFLITDDASIIELLCNKKGLLTSVIADLVSDPVDVVMLVVTTLRCKLVEDRRVRKSSKMAVFNTAVLRSLLGLYHWVGSKGLRGKGRVSKLVNVEVDEESRQLVARAAHALLLVLCTSHKRGVIFQGKRAATSYRKHNELVRTMLEELKEPWEDELQWELVLKTLVTSPDLVKGFVPRIEGFLEPRNSLKWHRTVNFYKQLVESLDPEVCVQSGQEVLGELVALTAPPSVLKWAGGESLLHARLSVRHQLASLLCTMLRATDRFLASAEAHRLSGAAELRAKMAAHFLKHLPTGSVLARTWRKAVDEADEEQDEGEEVDVVIPPPLQEHVHVLLDLLDAYGRCCPRVLSCSVLEPQRLLADVHALSADGSETVKALVMLFTLDPSGFSLEKGLLKTAVALLLGLMDSPNSSAVQPVLLALLHRTGLFSAGSSELLVWLHCYLGARPDSRPAVASLLTEAVALVAANPHHYADVLSAAVQSAKQHGYAQHDKDIDILQVLLDNECMSKDVSAARGICTLSPLLPGVLQSAANIGDVDAGVVEFISCVVVHLLHDHVSPGVMRHLLEQWKYLVLSAVWKYVRGWLPESTPAPLRKPFGVESMERRLSQCLLQPGEIPVQEIFGDASSYTLDEPKTPVTEDVLDRLPVKDSFHVMLLLKLSLFHVGQLIARGSVIKQLCENYQQSTLCLLSILKTLSASQTKEVGEIKLVENYFRCFFTNPAVLSAFVPLAEKHTDSVGELVVDLVVGVVRVAVGIVSQDVLAPLRQRLVSCASSWLRRCCEDSSAGRDDEKLLSVLELLQFDLEELVELLEQAAAVPTELLCRRDGGPRLSPCGAVLSLLLQKTSLQCGSSARKGSVVLASMIKNVARHVMSLQSQNLVDISTLEEGFVQFMRKYPQHLAYIQKGLLKCLLKNPDRSASAVKICVFLVERNEELVGVFSKLALKRKHGHVLLSASCVLPVLSAALSHGPDAVGVPLLQSVYELNKNDIHRSILQYRGVPAWVRFNVSTIVMLVDKCMGTEKCKELCRQLANKCVVRGEGHRQLLHSVFVRASREGDGGALASWCNILTGAAATACRRRGSARRLDQLCRRLRRCVALAGPRALVAVQAGKHWWGFAQVALATGLGRTPRLLGTLAEMCGALYEDGSNHAQLVELFNKLVLHSRFMPAVIGNTSSKRSVMELMLVLTRKAPSVMNVSHVATFLGSYGASLSITDQLILKLLRQYESSGVSLQRCSPYLWGEAAVIHYSVRSRLAASLWQQPSVWQVLDLFTPDMVASTVGRFPLGRPLETEGELHASQLQAYDPAFYLPLLSHLLSPENLVPVNKVHQSGALALCIAALSSDHHAVRRAACHVISRFYFHLEGSRQRKGKQLWLQLVDALRDGMPTGPEVPQLPSVATLYLAHASRHISNPGSTLYSPLHNYVCLRPAFDLHSVPDFLRLFHSDDVYYKDHRQFILEVLRSGIRREADFDLVHKAVIYKMLMTFYSSVLADENCKVSILQVLQSSVKLPAAASVLVTSYGLLSWLDCVVARLDRDRPRRTNAALHVLCYLWTSLSARPGSAAGPILKLLLSLLPKLHPQLLVKTLGTYLDALSGAAAATQVRCWLTLPDVTAVLDFCRGILGSVKEFEDLLRLGCKFAERKIRKAPTMELRRARHHLHSFVLTWLKQTPQPS